MEREFKLIIASDGCESGFILVSMWDASVYSNLKHRDFERVGLSTRIKLSDEWEEVAEKDFKDLTFGELSLLKNLFNLTLIYEGS